MSMNIVRLSHDTAFPEPCVATIGFFDGVHKGHRYLIRQVVEAGRQQGLRTVVVTFDRHPRQVVKTDYRPLLLSTFDEKMHLMASTGADTCVVLPFDARMASLSAHDFMLSVLRDRLQVATLITGYDNRFGHNRAEGFDDYVAYGKAMGIEVRRGLPFVLNDVNVSSSVIRAFLQEGEVAMAAQCLGYRYVLEGTVVAGEHIGTRLGYPTANLQPCDSQKLVPAAGAYAVRVYVADEKEARPAMLNIGRRPTFDGQATTIEAHVLHYSADIYGKPMSVEFVQRLRPERKFRNGAELASQLARDEEAAGNILRAAE